MGQGGAGPCRRSCGQSSTPASVKLSNGLTGAEGEAGGLGVERPPAQASAERARCREGEGPPAGIGLPLVFSYCRSSSASWPSEGERARGAPLAVEPNMMSPSAPRPYWLASSRRESGFRNRVSNSRSTPASTLVSQSARLSRRLGRTVSRWAKSSGAPGGARIQLVGQGPRHRLQLDRSCPRLRNPPRPRCTRTQRNAGDARRAPVAVHLP